MERLTLRKLAFWQRDWFDVGSREALGRRREFYRKSKRSQKRGIAEQLNDVRSGWFEYVDKFAHGLQDALDLDPTVATPPSVLDLCNIAEEAAKVREPDARVWFECLFNIDQAFAQWIIERDDSMRVIQNDLFRFMQLLSSGLFVGPSEPVTIYSYHDPDNFHMVDLDGIGIGKRLEHPTHVEHKNRLRCRPLRGGGIAHLHDRPKFPFFTWLKMMKQLKKGHKKQVFKVTDRAACRIVVSDVETVHHVAFLVQDIIEGAGGELLTELESNLMFDETDEVEIPDDEKDFVRGSADPTNSDSNEDFKVAKFDAKLRGRVFEIQFMTYADHYSGKRATSTVGHSMYKLEQGCDYHLPFRFPQPIYGFNWSNKGVRDTLREWKRNQLGWFRNPDIS